MTLESRESIVLSKARCYAFGIEEHVVHSPCGLRDSIMIELIATVIITVSSALLFGYWFRYTCLLILTAKTARDYGCEVAEANHLCFPKVQSKLRERAVANLDRLRDCLDRDYIVVIYMLGHTTP